MRISFEDRLSVGVAAIMVAGLIMSAPVHAQTAAAPSSGAQADSAAFKKEIERLSYEKDHEAKRANELAQEREQFVKEVRRVENLNSKYSQEISDLKGQVSTQQQAFEDRLLKMEAQLKGADELKVKAETQTAAAASQDLPVDVERKANEILSKGGDLDPEDEKFKEELARAHYNMGNVYFERGEYQRSVVEYYQAVDLMPYDADAHYNLAFVSSEYLGDQETALKHYQWYLYLKPKADDRKLVEEKIVAAKLSLRGKVESKIDKTELSGHTNVAR